jgi:hypothetical protein
MLVPKNNLNHPIYLVNMSWLINLILTGKIRKDHKTENKSTQSYMVIILSKFFFISSIEFAVKKSCLDFHEKE